MILTKATDELVKLMLDRSLVLSVIFAVALLPAVCVKRIGATVGSLKGVLRTARRPMFDRPQQVLVDEALSKFLSQRQFKRVRPIVRREAQRYNGRDEEIFRCAAAA